MSKRSVMMAALVFLIFAGVAGAHPPSNIELSYDSAGKVLRITMDHVTHNPKKHYIRRIIVYKNDEDPRDYYYPKQTSAQGMTADIALEADPGDVIRVKAVCSEAGYREQSLTITEEGSGKTK